LSIADGESPIHLPLTLFGAVDCGGEILLLKKINVKVARWQRQSCPEPKIVNRGLMLVLFIVALLVRVSDAKLQVYLNSTCSQVSSKIPVTLNEADCFSGNVRVLVELEFTLS
jgi:hypothetical protein